MLAEQRGLLVSGDAGDGDAFESLYAGDGRVDLTRGAHVRHHREWNLEQVEKLAVPRAGMNIEEHGAGGIADVGGMEFALRQFPDQPGIHGTEGEFAGLGEGAGAGDVIEDPGDFRRGEIGVDQQSGALLDQRLAAIAAKALAEIGGAAILPDDRVVDGLTGLAVPDDRGLALVGDADRSNVGGARSQLVEGLDALRRI